MAPAVAERIFEPFFSTKETGKARHGLAMAHGIVHEHGGHVIVGVVAGTRLAIPSCCGRLAPEVHEASMPLETTAASERRPAPP